MLSDQLKLRLPDALRQRLESLIAMSGRTESDLIHEAIEEYLFRREQMQSCFDLAMDAGLIGCINTGKLH